MRNSFIKKSIRFLCLFLLVPFWITAQNLTVTGKITDKSGEPIIGVNVTEKGTTNGIASGIDGNYSLSVSGNATLEFSYVGYLSQSIPVQGKNQINVVMQEDTKILGEVVVIGYGTAKRSDVTGSISSIGSKDIKAVPSTDVMHALQGRTAGVDFIQSSSRPGANMQIRIRGARSLTASNDPLIVLDGIPFPGSLNDINPYDVKSIDILKDASSTAIYGSRGANGVIMITTNRGDQGKPTVSYNGYYGVTSMFSRYPMMNGPEFVKYREEAAKNGSTWAAMSPDDNPDVSTDWQKLVFKSGYSTNHNVTVSAPTKGGSYTFGIGYNKDDGLLPLQSFERYSARGSFDQQIGILHVGMNLQNSFSTTSGGNLSIPYSVLATNPTISPYNADGSPRNDFVALNSSDRNWNPLFFKWPNGQRVDLTRAFASYNTLFAEVKLFLDGLKYRINLGGNYRQVNGGQFTGTTGPYSGATGVNTPGISSASVSNAHDINWVVENLLTYDKTFGKHTINAVAMYSAEQLMHYRSYANAQKITIDDVQFYNLGLRTGDINVKPEDQQYSLRGLISYMGRVAYQYDNRYMLSATLRSDGASVLAKGHKWHTYPAVSAGWNIANESFMKNITQINYLKLRVGYGQTSNQSVNPYQTFGMMASSLYDFGPNPVTGYYPNTAPNPNLKWEYSETVNYGLDFGLFEGRLMGTAEYYVQNTNDLLMSLSLPASSGINGSYLTNIGATQNKGFELTLNGTILENKDGWSWNAGVNIYTNKNKITQLAGVQKRDIGNMWFVGYPINSIYDYNNIGIYQKGEEAVATAAYGLKPGDIKVAYNLTDGDPVTFDANGVPNRKINATDKFILGSTDADFQGGFNTTVSYKNFDLGVIGIFRSGGLLISTIHANQGYLNQLSGRRGQIVVDYWTPDNPNGKYPTPGGTRGDQDGPAFGSTMAYFDASYVKLRTITLGYNFKGEWMKTLGLSNGRIYLTCYNPFVISSPYNKETGLDPETNSPVRENTAATNGDIPTRLLSIGANTPATRSIILGVNLTF